MKWKRKYIVIFKKKYVSQSTFQTYPDNAVFCVKSLHSESIKRQFFGFCQVDSLTVKYRKSKRIIYQGNSYQEFLETIKEKKL